MERILYRSVEDVGMKYENEIRNHAYNTIWILSKDGKYGIFTVDRDGDIAEVIVPAEYDSIESAEKDMGYGHYLLKKDGKVGVYCEASMSPCEYDDIKNITDSNLNYHELNLYLVSKDGKLGLVQENPKAIERFYEVMPCEYDSFDIRYMMHPDVYFGTTPYIFAKHDGKISVFAKIGNRIERAFEDEYEDFKIEDDEGRKVIYFKKDGKWGVMGVDGKEMAPFEYDEVSQLASGGLLLRQGDKYALHTGVLGGEPTEAVYDKVYDRTIDIFGKNFVLCEKDGELLLVNKYEKVEYPVNEYIEQAYNERLDEIKENAHNSIKEANTETIIERIKNDTENKINYAKSAIKNVVLEIEELTNEKDDTKDLKGSKENALSEIDSQIEKGKNDLTLDKDDD